MNYPDSEKENSRNNTYVTSVNSKTYSGKEQLVENVLNKPQATVCRPNRKLCDNFDTGVTKIKEELDYQVKWEQGLANLNLYLGHIIKEDEEIVIGPEEFQRTYAPSTPGTINDTVSTRTQSCTSYGEREKSEQNTNFTNALQVPSSTHTGVSIKSEPADDDERHEETKDNLADHVVERDTQPVVVLQRLPIASKTFRTDNYKDLMILYINNTDKTKFTCDECKQDFSTLARLKVHKRKHYLPPLYCKLCNKVYKYKIYYDNHLAEHCRNGSTGELASEKKNEEKINRNEIEAKVPESKHVDTHVKAADKTFKSERHMRNHLRSHTIKQKRENNTDSHRNTKIQFYCDNCDQYFSTFRDLRKHNKIHRRFLCKICNKVFMEKSSLRKHSSIHLSQSRMKRDTTRPGQTVTSQTYLCDICNKAFDSRSGITNHIYSHESNKPRGKFQCEICKKCFTLKANMLRHKRLHSENYFSCEICHKKFKQKHYLAEHKTTHTQSRRRHVCDCGKTFHDKPAFNRHKHYLCEQSGTQTNVSCGVCKKEFTRTTLLEYHMLRYHQAQTFNGNKYTMSNIYICDYCDKQFKMKRSILAHMHIHTVGHKPFKCQMCHKSFTRANILARHMLVHTDKSFKTTYSMRKHDTSSTSTNNACDLCDKQFATKFLFKQHCKYFCINDKLCSTRPYSCDVCKKRFTNKPGLSRHTTNNHMSQYTCDICQRSFGLRKKLVRHMRYHDKKFSCGICLKTFASKRSLNSHIITHTTLSL